MRGRLLAGLALVVLLVLVVALYRGCRLGGDPPGEEPSQVPPAEESHYRDAPAASPQAAALHR